SSSSSTENDPYAEPSSSSSSVNSSSSSQSSSSSSSSVIPWNGPDEDCLVHFFDFDNDAGHVTKNGSNLVESVVNRGFANSPIEQDTTSKKPLWISSDLDGYDAIEMAPNDFLEMANATYNVNNGFTAFAVVRDTGISVTFTGSNTGSN